MTTERADKPTRAAAAAATRQRLLDVGRELLLEHSTTSPIDNVRVSEVARRAGLTTGAVYGHWDSQEAYRQDLLEDLLNAERQGVTPELAEAILSFDDTGLPLAEIARLGSWATFEDTLANNSFRLMVGLWSQGNPAIQRRLGESYASVRDRMADLYAIVADHYDLELRPPFTLQTLAGIAIGLLDGLVMQHTSNPELVPSIPGPPAPDGTERLWNSFALGLLAVLVATSRPRSNTSDGDRRDFFEFASDVLQGTGTKSDNQSASPPPI